MLSQVKNKKDRQIWRSLWEIIMKKKSLGFFYQMNIGGLHLMVLVYCFELKGNLKFS
ncbi:hypothetical protein STRDD10_00666 [Streptococcus sp. DD10]|nr:hypothetical protein STRDD10_00666 [Streptococcus sp. DD10]